MELQNLLERVLGSHEGVSHLKISSMRESSCTKPGQNFMSVVSLVHVEGEFPDGEYLNMKSQFNYCDNNRWQSCNVILETQITSN